MTQNINVGLQNKLLLALAENEVSVFNIEDAKRILPVEGSAIRQVLMNLVNRRRLQRIERGKYLFIPERAGQELHWTESSWAVVPYLIDNYYVGFWTAMNFWNMTEQIPRTVFVVTTKRKRNLEFGNQRFEFVTLAEKKFFGFVEQKTNKKQSFNISSMEKTILDGLMHPEYCGGIVEVTKAMWNVRGKVDWQSVIEMAERTGINAVMKRLGYLLSVLNIEEEISRETRNKIRKIPYHYLDPTANKSKIKNSKEYGLVINLTKNELLDWMWH